MNLNLAKCAITWCPNKSKLKPNTIKYIQGQNIKNKKSYIDPKQTLHVPSTSPKWKIQIEITTKKSSQNQMEKQPKLHDISTIS